MLIGISIVAIVVLAIVVLAARKPDHFRVQRSREIAASPEKIAALVQDFHTWTRWSPYEKKDPAMKREFAGAPSGLGSIYAWDGNKEIGAGRMEIIEATPSRTAIKLEFFRPFKATNTAEFTLEPAGSKTRVTWAMFGNTKFVCKVISLFINMDEMCGRDFAAGLEAMDAAVTGNESGDCGVASARLLAAQ